MFNKSQSIGSTHYVDYKNTSNEIKNLFPLHQFPSRLMRVDNLVKNRRDEPDRVTLQPAKDDGDMDETPEEKEHADYLYHCVNEITRHPDCLIKSRGTKFIQVQLTDGTYSVPTARVSLPSGSAVYAGFIDNRLIVSHGGVYHIEARVYANVTLLGSLGNLWAHFTGSHSRGYSDIKRTSWMGTLFACFAGLRDPLVFPGAEGQATAPPAKSHQNMLYESAAEFQAQLAGVNSSFPETGVYPPPHRILSITQTLPPTEDRPDALPGRGKIMFDIGGYKLELAPANKNATALLAMLDSRLSLEIGPHENLSYLLKLDMLIAEKTAEIMYNGMIFKDKHYSLNMIILKSYTEHIITKFNHLLFDKLDPQRKISEHLNFYSTISDSIPNIDTTIANAYEYINMDIISETVSMLKNRDFILAETTINEQLHNVSFNEKAHLHTLSHHLNLLKEAHKEYRQQLVLDEISPMDKVKYLNTQEIFACVITGDRESLINALIKLKFFHILEYTRINGISIYSHNFLVPGEMTDHWYLFSENEQDINFSSVEMTYSTELFNYIYRHYKNHPYMDLIMNLVELARLNEHPRDNDLSWYNKNIFPWKKTLMIIQEIIESNRDEKNKFTHHTLWREDFGKLIRHDKTIFVLLTFCISSQQEFIQIIRYFFDQEIILQAESDEQFIAAAKVEAMRIDADFSDKKLKAYELIAEYEQRVISGDFDLIIRAAVFWFFSRFPRHDDDYLSSLTVFYVLQKFISAQQFLFVKYKLRLHHDFTSVFELQASNNKESLEDYYQQFSDYKLQYSHHEAQCMTMLALGNSSVDYIDAIYPPKEIYTFMVFSRNFITNSLSPFNHFSMPEKNPGFLTMARLHSGKLVLLSTLAGFVLISEPNSLETDLLLQNLKNFWLETDGTADVLNRAAYSVNETVMAQLFPTIDANDAQLTTLLDILLKAPEEDSISLPQAPYTLVAVNGQDIMTMVKPYLFVSDESHQPLQLDVPFIKNIDFLTQATLISLSNRLKEVLRHYSWLDFVASTIPFFETLCRNWHDKDHTISFKEIMFDLFDLILLIVKLGGNFKKISENTLKHALHNALKKDIQRTALKQFIITELIAHSPQTGAKISWVASKEFTSFFCPLQPTSSGLIFYSEKIHNKVQESIVIANGAIRSERMRKKLLRQSWKADVNAGTLETSTTGIAVDKTSEKTHYYVVNDHDYFPAFRDSSKDMWRIVNHHMPNEKTYAVPVTRSVSGDWFAGTREEPADVAPSFERYHSQGRKITEIDLIKSEPMRVLAEPDSTNRGLINFHKRILRFYLYNNEYVRDLIQNSAPREHFLMGFHRTFFFRKEIIDSLKINGYSRDENFIVAASRALDERQEGIVRFRAVSAWRNKHDLSPEHYFALRIDIGNNKFIIDLKEMRKAFMTMDNRDVFTENEWLMMYNRSPLEFELIKYKDFDFMEDAQYFIYREANAPTRIIKNGILLKEPAWYKPSLWLNDRFNKQKSFSHEDDGKKKNIRYVARTLRRHFAHDESPEQFLFDILLKCEIIDKESAESLLRMVVGAKQSHLHSQAFLINKRRLSSSDSLLKVNNGILVGIYNTSGCLEHLLLSIGNGRFVGMRNSFFDSALPDRVSIVIAEQLGKFQDVFFKLHHKDQNFFVIVGEAYGTRDSIPPLLDAVPREKIAVYSSDGREMGYREQAIPRKNLLLGKDCQIELINDVKTRLQIKLHGAPFNVNHMDAIEFSDIIKGLPFLEDATFKLDELECIDLYSCFSGFGYRYSTAQILADELGIKIKAYPYIVIDGGRMEERRPEWFRWFTPNERLWGPTSGVGRQNAPKFFSEEYKQTQKIHRRLHDVINFVLRMKQKFSLIRERRDEQSEKAESDFFNTSLPINAASDVWQTPLIYFDIFQLLYNNSPEIPHAVGDIQLSQTSRQILEQIVIDYNIGDEQENIFIQQAFLEILLSIDEFKYLSNWFILDAEYHGGSSLAPHVP